MEVLGGNKGYSWGTNEPTTNYEKAWRELFKWVEGLDGLLSKSFTPALVVRKMKEIEDGHARSTGAGSEHSG